ncbi:uncharacterized protein LOC131172033 [Hevea brasiliensis]|uniref:uncharacterized protein LOC131172033 n=1 Tax=Hevea brasiliensis TaxID=3981 RepID=UPI0025F84474|nr:uncharacterized protein LOC131172033 [Hevea brasiliensis]
MRRSRRAATAPEPDVPDEVSAQDEAPAPRRRGRRPRAAQVEEQPPPVQDQSFMAQGPMDPMAATLAGLQRTIDMMAQYMVHPPQQQQSTAPRGEPYKQIINFKKLVPGTYDVSDDAYRFLDSCRQAGTELQLTDRRLIECMQHVMGPMSRQWMNDYVLPRMEGLTWAQFVQLFINWFVPESFRDQKQWAFEALRQNGRSVDEYATEFLELSRYAPTAVATETMKVKRFLKGLDRRYANLAMMSDQSFDVVVDRARQIEISYAVDDSGRAKKNRAEGSSGVPHMGTADSGGQTNYRGRSRNKRSGFRHKSRGFRPGYGSSSGNSSGYSD